jgi:hypothetical protein
LEKQTVSYKSIQEDSSDSEEFDKILELDELMSQISHNCKNQKKVLQFFSLLDDLKPVLEENNNQIKDCIKEISEQIIEFENID